MLILLFLFGWSRKEIPKSHPEDFNRQKRLCKMKEINKMKLEKEGQPRELELELEHVEVQEHKFDGKKRNRRSISIPFPVLSSCPVIEMIYSVGI